MAVQGGCWGHGCWGGGDEDVGKCALRNAGRRYYVGMQVRGAGVLGMERRRERCREGKE